MSDTRAAAAMPVQPIGPDGPLVSRIALGCMGLSGTWNRDDYGPAGVRRAVAAFEAALGAGITLYDHADIYGAGTCEEAFAECLKAVPGSRERITIATKCGIGSGLYNLSYAYIMAACERSLRRLGIDFIDLYQLHRPDPLTHPAETARALDALVRQGKVRYVGVSNYHPEQVRALQRYLQAPIRSNQVPIHLRNLHAIYEGPEGDGGDGTLDQCMALGMTPLAYSPLAWGTLTGRKDVSDDPLAAALLETLREVGAARDATPAQVALAWLLAHPAGIVPLVGSADPKHIAEGAGAASVTLTREEWYRLWVAARGKRVP